MIISQYRTVGWWYRCVRCVDTRVSLVVLNPGYASSCELNDSTLGWTARYEDGDIVVSNIPLAFLCANVLVGTLVNVRGSSNRVRLDTHR